MNCETRNNDATFITIPSSKKWQFSKTFHSNLYLHNLLKSKKDGNKVWEDIGRGENINHLTRSCHHYYTTTTLVVIIIIIMNVYLFAHVLFGCPYSALTQVTVKACFMSCYVSTRKASKSLLSYQAHKALNLYWIPFISKISKSPSNSKTSGLPKKIFRSI